jgi:AAA domain-containing protein
MSTAPSRIHDALSRLSAGWFPTPYPPLEEFLAVWKDEVAQAVIQGRDRDALYFQASLPNSRLRGFGAIQCMAIGGAMPEIPNRIHDFLRLRSGPGRILFLFCFSEAAEAAAEAIVHSERCIVWTRKRILEAWTSGRLLDACREIIRERVPLRMLMPYDITISARGPMFYGRDAELAKLLQEDGQSFAITGPGRIGKTSLVNRLEEELIARGNPESPAVFSIDFFECADKSDNGLARKIAMAMEPGRRADRTTANDLAGFIEYQKHRLGCNPTLIFDEVDEVCGSALFKEQLTVPARHEHARFILVGKSGLLRFTKDNSRAFSSRLRLVKLGEIDADAGRKLLYEPIRELGLEFENFDALFGLVERQTGRSPHMIQFYGQRLVELAAEEDTRRIQVRHAEQLKWDHQTACFFLSPLGDLEFHPAAHLIALALLKSGLNPITPVTIQDIGKLHGLSIAHSEAIEIGDILVIQNILLWAESGGYRLANAALPEYAGKMGYLTRGLADAKRRAQGAPRSKAD